MTKLDYKLKTSEERLALVNKILEENPNPTTQYLEVLANYLVFCMEKEERNQKKIMTDNRKMTINKRETSFEGLVAKFENGEDGIYNILDTGNKNVIFRPKLEITPEDLERVPEIQQAIDAINYWKKILEHAEGRDAFIAKKALIEARKNQYSIKNDRLQPIQCHTFSHYDYHIPLDSEEWVDENGEVRYKGVSLLNPVVCSTILCNYSKLKEHAIDFPDSPTANLMYEFDEVSESALLKYPLYYRIVVCKIDGIQNIDIQKTLDNEFGISHSLEYISSLWRKKIPNLIASEAEDRFLNWWFLEKEKGTYKKCSRCGKIKLAYNKFFSKNNTSKDGFYSICKECRRVSLNSEKEV